MTGTLRTGEKSSGLISLRDLREDLSRHGYLLPGPEDSFLHRLLVRRGEFICALTILLWFFSLAFQLDFILIEVASSSSHPER